MLFALDENDLGPEEEKVCLAFTKLFIEVKALLIIVEIDSSTSFDRQRSCNSDSDIFCSIVS